MGKSNSPWCLSVKCRHDVHTKRMLQFSRKHQSLLKRNLYPCNMATRLKLKCHGSCHILIWQSYERPEQAWCFLPVCFVHLLSFFKFLLFILERKKKDSSGLEDCLETTRTASQRRLCNAKASKASKTQTLSVCESQIIIQQQVNPATSLAVPKLDLSQGEVCVLGGWGEVILQIQVANYRTKWLLYDYTVCICSNQNLCVTE